MSEKKDEPKRKKSLIEKAASKVPKIDKGGTDADLAKNDAKKKGKLKKGDYMIQVHIIEARELVGKGGGDMSDPVCQVEIMDKKYSTNIIKQSLNCVWDQILVFELSKKELEELRRATINVRVLDANRIKSDVLIGGYQFDLSQVYFNDHHEVFRQWVALMNPSPKIKGIQGYLKCSVVVLGPDDEQYTHTEAEQDDEAEGMMAVLMPPSLEQTAQLLKVQIYQTIDLPEMDQGLMLGKSGRCDPYVKIQFAGAKLRTKHFTGQDIAAFNMELQIPVMEPTMSSAINVQCYDWDQFDCDDLISSFRIDYGSIKDHPDVWSKPKWHNMYGAPEPTGKIKDISKIGKEDFGEKMNQGYIEGSFYRGRILLSASVAPHEDPQAGIAPIEQKESTQLSTYIFRLDVYEGSEVSPLGFHQTGKLSKKLKVEMCIGKHDRGTDSREVNQGRVKWYSTVEDLIVQFPEDINVNLNDIEPDDLDDAYQKRFGEVPDVFIYLSHDDKKGPRISFKRYPVWKLIRDCRRAEYSIPPTWEILQECKANDLLSDDQFPGTLLISLRGDVQGKLVDKPGCRPLANKSKKKKKNTITYDWR